ncbi:hypothetical protein ACFFSW_07500 [Saccharothrix longispora]|uniref:Uncharacterized protein n=1 Tax=Saccharothrix longispora TaxID=33920 RepID=A0ABU1PMA9_9PSEU|nr:hypothetical protein [Saccharothrix longispora]MDR6591802.1 hypothetical protein [Saccharothrix longispora]
MAGATAVTNSIGFATALSPLKEKLPKTIQSFFARAHVSFRRGYAARNAAEMRLTPDVEWGWTHS